MELTRDQLRILKAILALLERPKRPMWDSRTLAAACKRERAYLFKHFPSRKSTIKALGKWVCSLAVTPTCDLIGQSGPSAGLEWLAEVVQRNHGVCRVLTGEAFLREDPEVQHLATEMWADIEASLAAKLAAEGHSDQSAALAATRMVDLFRGSLTRASESDDYLPLRSICYERHYPTDP